MEWSLARARAEMRLLHCILHEHLQYVCFMSYKLKHLVSCDEVRIVVENNGNSNITKIMLNG